MIEVNLIPGGKKRRRSRNFSIPMPDLGGLKLDKFIIAAVAAAALALGGIGFTWFSTSGTLEEMDVAIAEQLEDSARFADLLARTNELTARRDSILQRIAVIQEIDQGRFTWPHIFDELARALPDYTWLTGITEIADFPEFELSLDGASGDLVAMTTYMSALEASPFFRDVRTINSGLQVEQPGSQQQEQYYAWQLQLFYEPPGDEYIETVPLFEDQIGPEEGSSVAGEDETAGEGVQGDTATAAADPDTLSGTN